MKHLTLSAALAVAVLFGSSLARSQSSTTTPRTITYQGTLQQANGKAAKDSTYNVTVRLYSDEAGTKEVWRGTYPVQTLGGVFSVGLGSGDSPFPEASSMDKQLWLGMQIEGNEEMRPLSTLSASAFAFNVPDKSISASKISADYIKSVSINGQTVSGNGRDLNIETGDGIMASIDEATNSVFLKSTPTLNGAKGGSVEGNTTITGSLTVTGSTTLGTSGSTPVYINSLTPGSIPFIGTSKVLAQDNARLVWDYNNYRLGLLTNTPVTTLDVNGGVRLGGSSNDTIAVRSRFTTDLIPKDNLTQSLGDDTHRWSDLYLGPHSLTMSDGSVETQLTMPPGGVFAVSFFDVSGGGAPIPLNPDTPPLQVDQYGMTTSDLRSDAITSGNSIKIDGTNNPRTIQGDDDMIIYVDPHLDNGHNTDGAAGKTITIISGPGGQKGSQPDAGSGGNLTIASGTKGANAVSATDGSIILKTGGSSGNSHVTIAPANVTINAASSNNSATNINTTSGSGSVAIGNTNTTSATVLASTANVNNSGSGATNVGTGSGNTVIGNGNGTTEITGNKWSMPSTGQLIQSYLVVDEQSGHAAINIPAGTTFIVVKNLDASATINAPSTGHVGQSMYIYNANDWNNHPTYNLIIGSNFVGASAPGTSIAPGYGIKYMWVDDDGTGSAGWIEVTT